MKTLTETQDRLQGQLVLELNRRVEEASKRLPHRCRFNIRQQLDTRKTVDGEPNANYNRVTNGKSLPVIGMCGYGQEDPETWAGNICEEAIDAQRCSIFDPIQDKDMVKAQMMEELLTPGWLDEHLPGVAELLWVLDRGYQLQLPWWKEVWFKWVLQINIEPVLTPDEAVTQLLGSGADEDSKELLQGLYEEPVNVVDPGAPPSD